MKLVEQPDTQTCGQAVVATLTGISFMKACLLVGHAHKTYLGSLCRVFRLFGFDCPDHLIRKGKKTELPARCVIKLSCTGVRRWGHWAAYFEGTVYDPWYGKNPKWPKGVHITSFLPLRLRSR